MGADNGRPLEKNLIAPVGLVLAHPVVHVRKLQTQPIELAQIPSHKRRIAQSFLARAFDARRIIKKKSRRPILVELQLGIAIAAIGLPPLSNLSSKAKRSLLTK